MEFANCKGQKGREQANETRSPGKSLIMKGFIFSPPPLGCWAVTEVAFQICHLGDEMWSSDQKRELED